MTLKYKYQLLILFTIFLSLFFLISGCSKKARTARYYSDENGKVDGVTIQTIYADTDTTLVTAIPNEGYVFSHWDDTESNNPQRQDFNIKSDIHATAIFVKKEYQLTYEASKNGTIEGKTTQTIAYKEDGLQVRAIPNEGYRFVKWSDEKTEPSRIDDKIIKDLAFIAYFEKIKQTYTLNYKNATENTELEEIELEYGLLDYVKLTIPKKEYFTFKGWYLDAEYNEQVTNEKSVLLIDNEIFKNESKELYAKWEVNEKLEYRVLLVYTTEVKASLELVNGRMFEVNFKMSDLERQICHLITKQFRKYINEMLDGLVTIIVDEYFTTKLLTRENIHQVVINNPNVDHKYAYNIYPSNIPEISGMIPFYDTVFTTTNMNDVDQLLDYAGGSADYQYATLHFDYEMRQTIFNGDTIDVLLDPTYREWESIMTSYSHEFIHSIETGISVYSYHSTTNYYYDKSIYDNTIIDRLYLLNQANVNGKRVGIPQPFWKNEFYYPTYQVQTEPRMIGDVVGKELRNGMPQRVPKGFDALPVTAVAYDGYEFVGWSDGVMTATRQDTNLQADFTVTALFKPKIYQVIYHAGEGGSIQGKTIQYVESDTYSETVRAVADEGYRFIGWSDGQNNELREDRVSWGRPFVEVTALFEKIE